MSFSLCTSEWQETGQLREWVRNPVDLTQRVSVFLHF